MDTPGRMSSLYLLMGFCMGLLSDDAVLARFVEDLKAPEGLHPSYVIGLRDVLSTALKEANYE